jgi:RNA recognition motif-containing protein
MSFDLPATAWPKSDLPRLTLELSKTEGITMKNIFVGNLDFSATEGSLRDLFANYGNVERVSLITDRDTGRSRGFAFVEMTDDAAAGRAIAGLNGTELDGRTLNINEARPKSEGGRRDSGRGGGFSSRRRSEPRW